MSYIVEWRLIGDDGCCLDADFFPKTFGSYEEAMAFILSRMEAALSFGYDRVRRFWWLRGAGRSNAATRFHILGCPSGNLPAVRAGAEL